MIDAIKAIDGWDQMTAQQIADALKATGVTNRPVNRAELVHLLNLRGMLRKIVGNVTDEKWSGSVLAMQDVILQVGSDEQKDGIRMWFSHITNVSNNVWDTTQIAFAAPFWQMAQTFADQPTMPTTADFAAIAELGGGWRFADVTAEQVQAALDQEAIEVARREAEQVLAAVQARANAAVEAAAVEYRAGRYDSIVSAAEASWNA